MNVNLRGWLRQPTTITGIATFVSAAVWNLAHVLTGETSAATAAGAVAFGAVHLTMNDSAAAGSIEKLVVDAVTAGTKQRLTQMLPQLMADGFGVAQAVAGTPPAPASAPAPAPTISAPAGGAVAAALGAVALLAFAGIGLSACANAPSTQLTVAEVAVGLTGSEQVALGYVSLPPCAPASTAPVSSKQTPAA